MAQPVIDLSALEAAVTEAEAGATSVEVFVQGLGDRIAKAVADALAADDAADQGTIDAANNAIAAEVARTKAASARIATAISA